MATAAPQVEAPVSLGYLEASMRPWPSLVFVSPILVVYELGMLASGPEGMRNGAEAWLRQFLQLLGFSQYFLLPVLVIGALLAWHHVMRHPWKFSWGVLFGMALESAALAVLLLLLARGQNWLFGKLHLAIPCALSAGELVGYCGAGIYEELLFRLLLLPAIAGLARLGGLAQRDSFLVAVVISSLLFSLAHYRIFSTYGDAFTLFSFVFRFLAGMFFAGLFLLRGFGIAAAAHTLYDILTQLA